MNRRNVLPSLGLPDLDQVTLKPLFVRLHPDRRNNEARMALAQRIRGEFEEMRGLALSLPQGAQLFGIPQEVCGRILGSLATEGVLRRTIDGRYALRGEDP